MIKTYLCNFLCLFLFCTVTAQRATFELKNAFSYVHLKGKKINIIFLEDETYAIVTEGIPINDINYNLQNGLLSICIEKRQRKNNENLVILYPKDSPIPKAVISSEWATLNFNQ